MMRGSRDCGEGGRYGGMEVCIATWNFGLRKTFGGAKGLSERDSRVQVAREGSRRISCLYCICKDLNVCRWRECQAGEDNVRGRHQVNTRDAGISTRENYSRSYDQFLNAVGEKLRMSTYTTVKGGGEGLAVKHFSRKSSCDEMLQ